ncbi:mitotic deacetylase-associated SANT domain protein isoform X1 [Rhinichthys klamathensis goyatoka]|uniref:mitotic deacetylase-associated SANT domain protein isoform X1 n=1 Tax=Rhinichthys klamathensis goyatoka TaxID=3034132 RepID=UPI0024B49337|nr:mitotic deacetylase-associated SANT domain protein isoform X1 [Rhinichthys klamathensis goyatoka]XP_056101555.1 mitotic deacetylase-associated SANT domain protein isoform X1 [Rhinichthys klamathensis goyatoka]XP_056101556.1 mitotic deacetylase-associated SANT domain protein isoform X1 [Rhinichthys klamathensis goyatoka]
MKVMSLQPQPKPNAKRTGKRITFFNDQGVAMKEASQHTEAYYGIPPSGPGHNDSGGVEGSNAEAPHMYLNSVIFSPEKGDQSRGHYQQTVPMKWSHQDPSLQPQQRPNSWSQGITAWSQNYAPYLGAQTVFAKQMHEGMSVQQQQPEPSTIRATEKQGANISGDTFRDTTKPGRGMDWEQQQAFQQTQKPGMLNPQQHGQSTTGNSVLQPFQLAFGQPKQNLVAGYYQVVQGNRTLPNLNYSTQTNSQHHLQQLQEQEQQQKLQMQRQMMHHQRQQQLEQQIRQQTQQQQVLQHQKQSRQISQSQLQQQAQQLNKTQQQQPQQHMQQIQLQLDLAQRQKISEQPHQNQHVLENYSDGQQPRAPSLDQHPPSLPGQSQETTNPPSTQTKDSVPQPPANVPQQSTESQQPGPRRSRRLSKEGGGPASDNPFVMPTDLHAQGSQNGASETIAVQDIRAAPTGVIQSTRRKRRVSQEVNLETLAQKASERESLPSRNVKQEPHRPWSPPVAPTGPGRGAAEVEQMSAKRPRDDSLMPLVIPVSVPVRQTDSSSPDHEQASLSASWPSRPLGAHDMSFSDYKTSVIVTRRRSLRNSLSESSGQNGGTESGSEADAKSAKAKRRPRPEPLFIPPPKLGTFIAPPIYSSITPYQSHLRSPVRLPDNPLNMPPYTPPPILSPVREGSGLYFSTFLSAAAAAAAANNQGLPPPATPKSATRSLLRSNSSDITPPVLTAMSEATPVSIEPRINIGLRYQAEVPELRERLAAQHDLHKAELVWAPLPDLEANTQEQQRVDDLMHLACSSALYGGGTNQELALHCLYESKGEIMGALACLLLKKPTFPKAHPLADYHYSGSDSWTPEERRIFNKGIAAYKKDFFMVQKMVSSKTVAQCVEFYYTYKKQVKIGRNGTLIYGEAEPPETKPTTEEEVDNKSSQKFESRKEDEESRKWDVSCDRKQENSLGRVTQTLQATENAPAVLVLRSQEDSTKDPSTLGVSHPPPPPPPPSKPRSETTGRKSVAGNTGKGQTNQEGEFPCKKCGRIFFKVKSRSAHMKSHAEAEKKAAALRQREAEQRAAAAMLAAQQNGAMGDQGRTRRASSDDSSEEEEDADDEDWH